MGIAGGVVFGSFLLIDAETSDVSGMVGRSVVRAT